MIVPLTLRCTATKEWVQVKWRSILRFRIAYCYSLIAHYIEVYDYGNSFENLIIITSEQFLWYYVLFLSESYVNQFVQYLYVVRKPIP